MNYYKQLELLTDNAKDTIVRIMKEADRIDICDPESMDDLEVVEELHDFPCFDKENHRMMAGIVAVRYTETGKVEFDGIIKGERFPAMTVRDLDQLNHEDIIYLADFLGRRVIADKTS